MSKNDKYKFKKLYELSQETNISIFKKNNILKNNNMIKKEIKKAKNKNLKFFRRSLKTTNRADYTKIYRTFDKKNKILNKIDKYSSYLNEKIPNYTPKPKKIYTSNDFYEIFSN
jgi:hypothetical protein